MRLSETQRFITQLFRSAYEQRHPNQLRPYVETLVSIAVMGAILAWLRLVFGVVSPSSPYLLIVLAMSLRWGLRLGLISSLVSVLAEEVALPGGTDGSPMLGAHALAHLLIYTAVAISVGLLASFYRRERWRAEKAAQQERQAAEYQRRMVGVLAHDLKAPITAVRGYVELARRSSEQGQGDRVGEALTVALAQVDRLTAMITDLVEASRIEQQALELRPVRLEPVLERLVTAFGSDPLHTLLLESPMPAQLAVRADPKALDRILDNLVGNAVKYSPEGGLIRLTLQPEGDGVQPGVLIRVLDEGIGVPAEERENIFAPYYRGSNHGLATGAGVGLYVCRELAQKMGGSLTYSPNPGGGSIFSLALVGAAAEPIEATPPPSPSRRVVHGCAQRSAAKEASTSRR